MVAGSALSSAAAKYGGTGASVTASESSQIVGSRSNYINMLLNNEAVTIGGRPYSGHAIDQMQGRGIYPIIVENTIKVGQVIMQNNGRIQYYDPINEVGVILEESGEVVTTYFRR